MALSPFSIVFISANLYCPREHPFLTLEGCCKNFFYEDYAGGDPICPNSDLAPGIPGSCCQPAKTLRMNECVEKTRKCVGFEESELVFLTGVHCSSINASNADLNIIRM